MEWFPEPRVAGCWKSEKSCSGDRWCTRGADTLSPGTQATPRGREVTPPSPSGTLRTQSSDRKLAQNEVFSSSWEGAAILQDIGQTWAQGKIKQGPLLRVVLCLLFQCVFPFEICNHSGISRHTDIEVPAWQASCHSISQGHYLGALLWIVEQVNGPRISGGFSDWRGAQE